MFNQKGVVLSPLLIWTVIIIAAILIAQDAVKQGYITIDLSQTQPSVQKENVIPSTALPSPTVSPTQDSKLTSAPVKIPIVVNSATKPTQLPKTNLPVLNGSNIFNMVNTFRTANGKPGLSVSDELCRLTEARADYMMANNMAAFKSSKTGGHTGLIDVSSQYAGSGVGENLAANLGTDASVIEIWKNSPPHKELMLWTEKNGFSITKGCVAIRVSEIGSIIVLLVGDK